MMLLKAYFEVKVAIGREVNRYKVEECGEDMVVMIIY